MKLIIVVTYRDDKSESFECADFPAMSDRFMTLYLVGFKRKMLAMDGIKDVYQFFEHET